MKHLRTTTILVMASLSLNLMSCKNSKKKQLNNEMHSVMIQDTMNESNYMVNSKVQSSGVKQILANYMILKHALVETNEDEAAKIGEKLKNRLKDFNVSSYTSEQKEDLKKSITGVKEHAAHIARSEMKHQREHFKKLSKNVIDIIAITGTEITLYQQFCPMYDKGAAWLSMSENIENPYYGKKMLTCGKVQKEIN